MPIKKVSQLAARRNNGSDRINRSTNLPDFDSFTICGWFKRLSDRGATEQRVLGYIDSGSGWSRLGWDNTGDFNFDTWSGADASMTDPGDNWFFAAISRLGSGVGQHYGFVGYIDGHTENQLVQLDSTSASANFEWLSSFDTEWVDGLVAGAALWRVPLSLAEIEKVFHSGPLSIKKGLMSYYPFDGHDKDVFNNYDIDTVTSINFESGPIIKVIKPRFVTVDLPSDTRIALVDNEWAKKAQLAVRLNNDADRLRQTSRLPTQTSFTITGWFREVGGTQNSYRYTISLHDSDTDATQQILLGRPGTDSPSAGNYALVYADDGSGWFNASLGFLPTQYEWFFASLTATGTGVGDITARVLREDSGFLNLIQASNTSTLGSWTPNYFCILEDTWTGEWLDGQAADIGLWNRPLSDDEIIRVAHEGPQIVKQGLISHYPMNGTYYDVWGKQHLDTVTSTHFEPGIALIRSNKTIFIPINEKLPEVAQFEVEHTNMPARP